MAETTEEKKTAEGTAETPKGPAVPELLQQREQKTQAGVNAAYDTGLNAQKQGLLNAYSQNMAAQNQQAQNVQNTYAGAKYDVGVQNARNAANLTNFADIRGVNTQAGSQHRLNLGNTAARANAVIDYQRQQAEMENERQKQLMTTTYQNQVQEALADNDYKRAAALLDDYNNNRDWHDQQAQILATWGNFEGYRPLYGDEAANGMQAVWNAQNPEVAYRTGQIDAETFKNITGKYPAGYKKGGGGGSRWLRHIGDSGPSGGDIGPSGNGGNSSPVIVNDRNYWTTAYKGGGSKGSSSNSAKIPSFNSVWGGGAF